MGEQRSSYVATITVWLQFSDLVFYTWFTVTAFKHGSVSIMVRVLLPLALVLWKKGIQIMKIKY